MKDKDMEYNLYILGETKYKSLHENDDIDESILFPSEWNISSNYALKNAILEEAIMNKKLIVETTKFQELLKDEIE